MIRSLAIKYAGRMLGTNHHINRLGVLVSTRNNHDQATWLEDNLKLKVEEGPEVTHVEAIPTPTGREGKVLKSGPGACALCRLNLRNLSYTDVMILSQFIKRNGQIVTYQESKLCVSQYSPWHDLNTYLEPDRKRDQPMKVVKPEYWKI